MNVLNQGGGVIDWETLWRTAEAHRNRRRTPADWDARASSPKWQKVDVTYAGQLLPLLRPAPSWTALDIGAGSGALAVPLAHRLASVTALDFSEGMLGRLRERCEREGISNVRTVQGSWNDDWDALGIQAHDLAIASRSLFVSDLGAALAKLNRAARRLACVVTPVGDGPHDRRVFDAVGRTFFPGADYLVVYGRLHQLGICANVNIIERCDWTTYGSAAQAADALKWMLRDPTEPEIDRLTAYLRATLVSHGGGWRFPAPSVVRWAIIWWLKSGLSA
jgi:SAM-dependent methyltransferase